MAEKKSLVNTLDSKCEIKQEKKESERGIIKPFSSSLTQGRLRDGCRGVC